MDLILLEHVAKLGKVGDLVNVKGGYGRNFLLPQQKAVRATKANIASINAQKEILERQNVERKNAAMEQAKALTDLSVKVVRQASEDGRLFGSVAVRDVAAALTEKGYEFSRQQIDLLGTVKTLGLYKAKIALHPEVVIECHIEVVRTAEATAFPDKQVPEKAA
jgi:large subunit ribosomal protein L9